MINLNQILHADCMDVMKDIPDKYFELAIVDVNYGIGVNHNMGRRKGDKSSDYKPAEWDKEKPKAEYFQELFRVSQNQIIWGANHFISLVAIDSPCWLMWDKGFSEDVTFAQFELAWTSFKTTCKKYDKSPHDSIRFHPTQKPVALYKWLLKNYAKPNDKILDTHSGSASSVIACIDMGFEYLAIEKDKDYYEASIKRIEKELLKIKLPFAV